MIYEDIFKFHGDDFEVYMIDENYHIGIEGYMGFEEIEDAIDLYSNFMNEFVKFLNKHYPREQGDTYEGWKSVYRKRAMDICHEANYYWVFLDGYKSTDIWDLHDYMKDIIEQLEEATAIINVDKLLENSYSPKKE